MENTTTTRDPAWKRALANEYEEKLETEIEADATVTE